MIVFPAGLKTEQIVPDDFTGSGPVCGGEVRPAKTDPVPLVVEGGIERFLVAGLTDAVPDLRPGSHSQWDAGLTGAEGKIGILPIGEIRLIRTVEGLKGISSDPKGGARNVIPWAGKSQVFRFGVPVMERAGFRIESGSQGIDFFRIAEMYNFGGDDTGLADLCGSGTLSCQLWEQVCVVGAEHSA